MDNQDWHNLYSVQYEASLQMMRDLKELREEKEQLEADNAALKDVVTRLARSREWLVDIDGTTVAVPQGRVLVSTYVLDEALDQPHPGQRLLSEVQALRKALKPLATIYENMGEMGRLQAVVHRDELKAAYEALQAPPEQEQGNE